MTRVALVHRDLHQVTRGGICTVYRCLAQHLTRLGAAVTLVTQESPRPVELDGVTVVSLPRTDNRTEHRQNVAKALLEIAADVVDCSTWEAETLAYLSLPADLRAPVLVRGEFSAARLGATDLARDERDLVHAADRVIAVSHYAAHDLAQEYGIAQPLVVANGVDRERFQPGPTVAPRSGFRVEIDAAGTVTSRTPIPELLATGEMVAPWSLDPRGRVRVVWVGKITTMKGWDILEAAAARLRDLATITVLLGHSPAYAPITTGRRRLTILQDLDDGDVTGFYRAADWLLSTSRWEGFGLAVAEALACGTPALLPEHLGTALELLSAGGGHTYRDLDYLVEIVARPDRAVGRLPEHFDWAINAAQTMRIYHDLIGR